MKIHLVAGFTLVELVTVLAIAAIFTTIAVPGYKAMIQNNKVASATNKLSASLHLARMEAVRRGVAVAVCPAASTAYTACGTSAQWSQGWIVFLDADKDNFIDATSDLVKVTQGFTSDAQVTTTKAIVSYDSAGFISNGAATFTLKTSGCTGNNARTIAVSTSGRVSIAQAACN